MQRFGRVGMAAVVAGALACARVTSAQRLADLVPTGAHVALAIAPSVAAVRDSVEHRAALRRSGGGVARVAGDSAQARRHRPHVVWPWYVLGGAAVGRVPGRSAPCAAVRPPRGAATTAGWPGRRWSPGCSRARRRGPGRGRRRTGGLLAAAPGRERDLDALTPNGAAAVVGCAGARPGVPATIFIRARRRAWTARN